MIIVEVKFKDDKSEKYKCVDFPTINSDWVTLYTDSPGIKRRCFKAERIGEINYWFE